VTATFALYVLINGAMVMGLAPVVGVPMPLLSYGGTVMMTVMVGFGLIQSVRVHRYSEVGRGMLRVLFDPAGFARADWRARIAGLNRSLVERSRGPVSRSMGFVRRRRRSGRGAIAARWADDHRFGDIEPRALARA
jgi:hypothetical protein